LLTPAGIRTLTNAFSYLGEDFLLNFTTEYSSPDFHNPLLWPFLAMVLLTIVLPHRWKATPLLITLSWTFFALYSFRNIPIYALAITPVLASSVTAQLDRASGSPRDQGRLASYAALERRVTGGALATLFVLAVSVAIVSSPRPAFGFSEGSFPIQAVASFGNDPPGDRPFHMFSWGGYLEYCCHPEILVFIDGQTDIYGSELTRDYSHAVRGLPSWRRVFQTHQIDWVLISPETGLAQVLGEADDWFESYRDETAVVFLPSN
jgi:hypothetical protein